MSLKKKGKGKKWGSVCPANFHCSNQQKHPRERTLEGPEGVCCHREGPLQPQGLARERSWEGMHCCTPGKKGLPHCTEHLSGNRKGQCKFSSCWAWKPASRQKETQVHPSFQQGKKNLGSVFSGKNRSTWNHNQKRFEQITFWKKSKHMILMASKSVKIQEEEMDLLLQGWNYSF